MTSFVNRFLNLITVNTVNEQKPTFGQEFLNILFIGPTGAGKSMLVNSIYNYLTYNFDEVSTAETVDCILPCHFQLQTPNFQTVVFTAGPQDVNEHFNDNGESVTQKPKVYSLKTEKYNCKVIDTPGLGDTRGAKQDEKNVDLIRNAIIEIEELHAICFVMPSNISKLTSNFEMNMRDLLSLFPKTALKNVFFFFTYANSPFFTTIGDTRSSLEEFISTFEATNNAKIPFGIENVCCVDSEAFMYFIGTTQGHKYQNRDLESFRISWDKSKAAIENFLTKLEDITPIKSNDILMTYEFEQVGTLLQLETGKILEKLIEHILMKISQISMNSKFKLKKRRKDIQSMEDFKTPELFEALQLCQNRVKDGNLKQFISKIIECYGNLESKKTENGKTGLQKPENGNKTNVTKLYKQKLVETLHLEENNIPSSKALCEKCREKESILPLLIPNDNTIFAFPKKIVDMNQDIDAVGIDLGTSRCCVAVNRKSGIETIGLDNTGGRLMPSYVSYDEEHPKCGQTVVDRLRHFSEATVFDSKRMIGKTIVNIDKIWPFKVVNLNNQPTIVLKTQRGEIQQTATEVAAVLLKYMKEKAESFQGKKLSKVVVTVPAAFTEAQEAATKEAAILAGWETVILLPEPIAAAFAYFIDRPIPNNSILLLFDLGGGTLDVCVFKIINDQIQIVAKNGDSKLGGRDFDNLLMDFFSNKLNMDYDVSKMGNNFPNLNKDNSETMVNLKDIRDKKFKLLMESQKIKHNLSVHNEDHLDSADIDPAKSGFIQISQQNFYDLSEDLLNKIQNTILSALYKSGYKANEINQVLHVGGGCRMAMIKKLLHEIFPSAKHWCEEHPDEVVAIGAAYYAYEIFSK
uniref:AIG1-type G domain-containing protein n=1 Tax=Panagrolaimus davidi TaxID=227884 RepID=A0A914PBX9_9BILA